MRGQPLSMAGIREGVTPTRPRIKKPMRRLSNRFAYAAIVAATAFITACSGSNQTPTASEPASPTASPAPAPTPPPASPGPTSGTGSATITGSLAGVTSAASGMRPAATVTITVTITGTGISATVSPGGTFVLNGVPAGNVELRFVGAGVDDRAAIADVADDEQIHIVVNVSGSRAIVQVTDRQKPEHGRELEGLIASINLGARTLVVNGTTVSVPATAIIRHGDKPFTLAELKVGQRVHVKGTVTGSTVVASEVMLQNENPNPGGDDNEAEVEGAVSGLRGGCPTLNVTVHSTHVSTSAATEFTKGTCAQVTNGTNVEVKGTRQTDGSIKATRVQLEKGD